MSAGPWIFGYGSLVWRPAFSWTERAPGSIDGWTRRFWQGSTDHRGVPGAPGRVVTLVRQAQARCVGMAYRVAAAHADDVLARLDVREQGGYERVEVVVALHDGRRVDALVYVATADNPNWLGPADLDAIAAQIRGSRGPSGDNVEYVLALADALAPLGGDAHVQALADRLRR